MGTSSRNMGKGGNTPLVPSWVDGDNSSEVTAPIPAIADPNRFSVPRGNMTRFSGGGDSGDLHRAASQYVRHSSGGVSNAVKNLGSARKSTAKLVGVLGAFSHGGASGVQEYLKNYNLIGKPAAEAFRDITDLICDDGGTTNEGIVRDAYLDTLAETTELRGMLFEDLRSEQIMVILEGMISRVVMGKLLNDIGRKVLHIPKSLKKAGNVRERIFGYVKGVVSDSFARLKINPANIRSDQSHQITDQVYSQVYTIFAESES